MSFGCFLGVAAGRLSLSKQSICEACRQRHISDECFPLFCIYKLLGMTPALGGKAPSEAYSMDLSHTNKSLIASIQGPTIALLFMNPSSSVSYPLSAPFSLLLRKHTDHSLLCTSLMEHGLMQWLRN